MQTAPVISEAVVTLTVRCDGVIGRQDDGDMIGDDLRLMYGATKEWSSGALFATGEQDDGE